MHAMAHGLGGGGVGGRRLVRGAAAIVAGCGAAAAALAGEAGTGAHGTGAHETRVGVGAVRASGAPLDELAVRMGAHPTVVRLSPRGVRPFRAPFLPGPADACERVTAYTSFDFSDPIGQSVNAQGGFARGEIQAITVTANPADFPIKINTIETIWASPQTLVTTTTEWSVIVWQGAPGSGPPVAQFSSDGKTLPHLQVPAGAGVAGYILFQIDPGDPEQIIINNDGSNTFSVGFRVDRFNQPPPSVCTPADPDFNVFPSTDVDGLASPQNNWIFAIQCPGNICGTGWLRFSQLPFLCRPTGDWVMRTTWEPVTCVSLGACCLPSGACEILSPAACQQAGGTYRGDGTACAGANCPQPQGACCFTNNSCLRLSQPDCATAGGTWQGAGTNCAPGNLCPQGACCLPSGSCITTTLSGCAQLGGTYRGANTSCANANCPQPSGACCFSNGNCLNLTQNDCGQVPGTTWRGAGTTCANTNCSQPACYANCDGSTGTPVLSPADFVCFLNRFRASDPYANCDGSTGTPTLTPADFVCFLNRFRQSC